jgi:iron complex outermembrane recepter protein
MYRHEVLLSCRRFASVHVATVACRLAVAVLLDAFCGGICRDGANIDVYVRNVLNRQVPICTLNDEAVNFLSTVGGPMLVQMSTPRTVGVAFNVPF